MTPPNFGAPGARCGKAATRSPPKALQTPTPTVEYSHSPLYLFKIYMLIMLVDNILYAATIAVPLALLCRVALPSSSPPRSPPSPLNSPPSTPVF